MEHGARKRSCPQALPLACLNVSWYLYIAQTELTWSSGGSCRLACLLPAGGCSLFSGLQILACTMPALLSYCACPRHVFFSFPKTSGAHVSPAATKMGLTHSLVCLLLLLCQYIVNKVPFVGLLLLLLRLLNSYHKQYFFIHNTLKPLKMQ